MEHKRIVAAYIYLFFLGIFGGHRFYLGHTGWGVAYLCTLGFLLVGPLIDLFLIPAYVVSYNRRLDHATGADRPKEEEVEGGLRETPQP